MEHHKQKEKAHEHLVLFSLLKTVDVFNDFFSVTLINMGPYRTPCQKIHSDNFRLFEKNKLFEHFTSVLCDIGPSDTVANGKLTNCKYFGNG